MFNWKYTIGWLVVGAAALVLEVLALVDGGTGDTFSEHVWALLEQFPILWAPLVGGFIWLGVHLFRRNRI